MSKYVSVGKILNFHGIKGEARVGYSKSQLEFFLNLDKVWVKDDSNNYIPLHIESAKPHKNVIIVKFEELNSMKPTDVAYLTNNIFVFTIRLFCFHIFENYEDIPVSCV